MLAGLLCFEAGPAVARPVIGAQAPSLLARSLSGEAIDLAALRGRVVLVTFWATWCAPCRHEMPVFDAYLAKHAGDGLSIVGVSTDFERDIAKVREVAEAIHYPVVVRPAITSDGFGAPSAVPVTYVIDKDGIVRAELVAVRPSVLDEVVLPLLKRQSAP